METRRFSRLSVSLLAAGAGILSLACNTSSEADAPVGGTVAELRVPGVTDAVYVDNLAAIAVFPGLTNESGSTRSTIYFADVSEPARPRLLSRLRVDPIGETSSFYAVPSLRRLYLAHFVQGVVVVDYGSPASPRIASAFSYPGFVPANYSVYCLAGRYPHLFVPFNNRRLQVYDLSRDPDNPAFAGLIEPFGYEISDGAAAAGTLLLVENGSRLIPVDISDPAAPVVKADGFSTDGPLSLPAGAALSADGRTAWIADARNGLRKLDLSDPSSPAVVLRADASTSALKVSRDGNLVGLARGDSGFALMEDMGSRIEPVVRDGSFGFAMNVFLSGNYGYVAMKDGGIKIVRIR